jgi:CDGSH-type Zn-finger protein
MGTNIKIIENGPALISKIEDDIIRVEHADGMIEHDKDNKMKALCRCSKSDKQPFCDGSHSK